MRPVDKGICSQIFANYSEAAPELKTRLGSYCSFCERFVPAAIEVEHKKPKVDYPDEALKWDNFLLSCKNCNSTKGRGKMKLNRYFWPDADNSFRAIIYKRGGIVDVNRALPRYLQRKASRTIQLVGLNRHPMRLWKRNKEQCSNRDDRWNQRREAWDLAENTKRQILQHDTVGSREYAISVCKQRGFFSIWMAVFANDTDMKQRLIAAFAGTAADCFDSSGNSIARPGGQI